MSTLLQCGQCKIVSYCSRQCQVEHWHRVHKQQCKYLAKQKVMPLVSHGEASCLVCKAEGEAGRRNMTKLGNPVLPCTLSMSSDILLCAELLP